MTSYSHSRTLPRLARLLVVLALLLLAACPGGHVDLTLKNGDIVFQKNQSAQGRLMEAATGSPISHVGMIFVVTGEPLVLEAVQPMRLIPFRDWMAQGAEERYVVKRLKDRDKTLTPVTVSRMRDAANDLLDTNYDLAFNWSDDAMYASELIWKLYERYLGVALTTPQRLGDLRLDDPTLARALKTAYGDAPPLDMPVVTPAALYKSPLLETITGE
ncbi:MAG: YiiX/YebB-like N1pC/P60 family cysteine hydrolase [Desulfovibrionaceae bacterium]